MDDRLHAVAEGLLSACPCSVEMPAGTGKTHLLAAAAAIAATRGKRSLVLTHTNAGVDAIRKRLRQFGVPQPLVRVDTITSWAFSLVGSYSVIAGISVAETPDWTQSEEYLAGATNVALSDAIAEVHSISFDYLFADEYQDCTLVQHEFILSLAAAIPKAVILGDRLQAIFTFAGPMATWDNHVLAKFPPHDLDVTPHRWADHNADLGRWLLDIRPALVHGEIFDFAAHAVPGLQFVADTRPTALGAVAHSFRDFNESVVLLDKWPNDVAGHASRLGGSYSVMEDISGKFMRTQLEVLPAEGDPRLALWFAGFAKECIVGLSGIDVAVQSRLAKNQGILHYTRPGIEPVLAALDQLRMNPTYSQLADTADAVRQTAGLRVYRWEAWTDTREAIAMTANSGEPAVESLTRVRERLRRTGRRSENRIASRTLLVKGLEYDHVIIADLNKMRDPRNLYVALSRARKSVVVLGASSRIYLANDR
ncbi:MAG: hypothetical protein EOP32_07100 [Rhodococcus sp. (in: high G+C Gram-positive bacteria)]|nr:MAG: hypothetical protein EOP32_07100 [Rhodococcus sp. (in: high G+C Gram-positive bacteria)]